jgi:serine/threonine-protein kinase
MATSPPARPPCAECGYLVEAATGTVNFCPKCGHDLRGGPVGEAAAVQALLGTVVADRYRLLSLLGEGGMGAVYKAEHIRMGKALALKVLRGAFAREAGAVARFRSEAQIVSRLSHPHTIAVFDFGELPEADGFYLAMEYVPGRDLAALVRQQRTLPEARTVEIGQQILGSLAEAHDAGIVHRDIKPGNVMLMQTRSGEDFVKVLDFGIAKLRDEVASASTTSVGAIIGTPSYLSPEQARGDVIDARADLYSVGALLYELLAGRPPFHGMSPVAVVSAHLHDPPPALLSLAPGVSEELAALVHQALEKKPDRRWASADEMRGALLQLAAGRVGAVTPRTPRTPRAATVITGELQLASRQDFEAFEEEVTRLRRSRVTAPLVALLLLAAAGLTLWRWADVYGFLQARVPAVGRALPAALRPADLFDGEEHEPNNAPTQANPLPLPPGPDGAPAGGAAVVRGHVGAKVSDSSGDIDVYRIEVPPDAGGRVLTAAWSGEREGEGIRGLDVALTLNRQRAADSERTSAPLVASVDHGGPGRPERLRALVQPGTYFLAVREKHGEATGPVEKPTDWYRLTVRLAAPEPGQEVEPNDEPEDAAARAQRYPEWRAVALRNAIGEGRPLRGDLSAADAEVLAVAPEGPAEAPEVLALVPDAGLAVAVEVWRPDATDLDPPPNVDRVRFQQRVEGAPGEVVLAPLGGVPAAGAPALVRLKAASGEGHWLAVGLGAGSASGVALTALADGLARAGRPEAALELCAAYLKAVPASPARTDVLLAAGRIAEALAGTLPPAELGRLERASRQLGRPILEAMGASLRYRAAFEAQAQGAGRLGEVAALRVVALGAPCTPADVAARAEAFLQANRTSALAGEARLWRARALEALALGAGKGEAAVARARALAAWKLVAEERGPGEAEARSRLGAPGAPAGEPATPVCP